MNALLLNLAESRQGKHLESTGICQYRLVPHHKLVQAAELFDNLISRSDVEMVGIGKLHLRLNFP